MAKKKKTSNRIPAIPTLWKIICRKPTISVYTKGTSCGVSHKKKAGAVKSTPKPPKPPKSKKKG